MQPLTLITPTSDRPVAFELCQRWMERALDRYRGEVQWIVADDGTVPVACRLGQVHLRRSATADGVQSFLGNLREGLERARHDKILFIEDDDWYSPWYLTAMSCWLDQSVLAGESHSKLYHIVTRRYRLCVNVRHAGLCQTGMRGELVPWLLRHLAQCRDPWVDRELWRAAEGRRRFLSRRSVFCIGTKGLPGKPGIGDGHRLRRNFWWDRDGEKLSLWIGPRDAAWYARLVREQGLIPHRNPSGG